MPILIDPAICFKELFVQAVISNSLSSFMTALALVVIIVLFSWVSNLNAIVPEEYGLASSIFAYGKHNLFNPFYKQCLKYLNTCLQY